MQVLKAAQTLGRLGGKSRSESKVKAARKNGKLGGSPKRYPPCTLYKKQHHFYKDRCACGYERLKVEA